MMRRFIFYGRFGQKKRAWHTICALVLMLALLAACGDQTSTGNAPEGTAAAEASSGKLKVVATFSILGDLVAKVGGDAIELRTLVPAGSDAHTFEPSPTDSAALVHADLIVQNGMQFETWLIDLYGASGTDAGRIIATENIEALQPVEEHTEHEEDAAHGFDDPHVWHDVNNVIIMVERIRDGLAEEDSANASVYQRNAEAYIAELKELDAYVVEQVATLPAEQRKLVTTHDTFQYFARRYGFEVVGTALGSASTEVADPSARGIAELVDEIKATGTRAIFAENVGNDTIMQRIANEAGVELGAPLYTDALGEPGSDGDTYVKMIRYNIDAIVGALSA